MRNFGLSSSGKPFSLALLRGVPIALLVIATVTPAGAQEVQLRAPGVSIFENVTLNPNFSPDPVTLHGISGGPRTASEIAGRADTATGPCVGFVDDKPDHTIVLTHFFNSLSLQVESPEDTTLVVRGPGGSWCNDDYQNSNPAIAGQWFSGTYQIWVGSYDRNSYQPYVIRVTEGSP